MCEQTEIDYLDGDVVWVKLGSCWWPGEVVSSDRLPPDVLPSFRKPPIAIVKFFQENAYEYVKNINSIYKYNCSKKNEFINKGLYMFRNKHAHMEKFPEDVIRAEAAVGGDIEILTRDEFQETKKESYAGLFGEPKKGTPGSSKKGKGRGRPPAESPKIATPIRKINKAKSDYKVHILVQPSKTSGEVNENPPTPSTSCAEPETSEDKPESDETAAPTPSTPATPAPRAAPVTPIVSTSGGYSCHACAFTTSRLNVLILHNKTHSVSFVPYTPSPIRKKPVAKTTPKSTPTTTKTPKQRRPRKEKSEKPPKKVSPSNKRPADEPTPVNVEVKKPKTDEEIKSSLLADWDDGDEESNDESSAITMAGSPEVPVAAESPAVPTPAELPSAQVPAELPSPTDKKPDESQTVDKPESSSDSKYEFCEDEDWPVEADVGRKIPRVKNPSKRKEDTKSLSLDDDEVAREVAELLNKTVVPELPSVPEPLKVEENFPEPSIVKSPDKKTEKSPDPTKSPEKVPESQPTRAIFKTKTFFRSRHSRSQDAIGKYVAEQLNAVERMDMSEHEINGTDVASSPEARESPPIEPVKVARLAPKIQLKKMMNEAAQLREKEKNNSENVIEETATAQPQLENIDSENTNESEAIEQPASATPIQDVIYPTQEIKPVAKDSPRKVKAIINKEDSEINNETALVEDQTETIQVETNVVESEAEKINQTEDVEGNFVPDVKSNDNNLQKSYEKSIETYMNESTASAVDALLSVSRETDRVPRIVSDDPPEDLFEDDIKDNGINNNVNGFNEEINKNGFCEETEPEPVEPSKEEEHVITHEDQNGKMEEDVSQNVEEESVQIPTELVEEVHESTSIETSEVVHDEVVTESVVESMPSESDLQIAEALINLPSTAIQNQSNENQDNICAPPPCLNDEPFSNETVETTETVQTTEETMLVDNFKPNENHEENVSDVIEHLPIRTNTSESLLISNNENMSVRFETEQEKSENLNAAQSLVQMSESIDHKINIVDSNAVNNKDISEQEAFKTKSNNGLEKNTKVEQKVVALPASDSNSDVKSPKIPKFDTTSSKLLKILEEPSTQKNSINKTTPTKQLVVTGKEKILNFDVAKSSLKAKTQSPKRKIIIRRTGTTKNLINNLNEMTGTPDNIIITPRSNKQAQDGSGVQTYTIQTSPDAPSDANTIIIQQKIRKISKPAPKLQKIKPQNSLVMPLNEPKVVNETTAEDAMFDINSMPIVLSDDILTPESIEKMPIVMSDGNIITNPVPNPPKLVKTTKQAILENEKIAISPAKPEMKTLLMNPVSEVGKVTTPNILSKSSKLRGAKPMLVIDKATGKQKIIMTKAEPPKEVKQPPTIIQSVPHGSAKTEKFIILPSGNTPRAGRTQKIVIDPQTGKAHVLVAKGQETQMTVAENKPVSAKLLPSSSDASTPGNTVMIITNAQGTQSRIVLTPEHEKILFPNKQQPNEKILIQSKQPNMSQLKTITHRISTNTGSVQKTVVTTVAPVKTQTKIVPKQKSAIITSKGQLIVGGRVATTAQNIAPMPEIRPVPKRIIAAEPKKLVQTIQKSSPEPLIFLQQKSGAVMQLTAAQFEHLQRTGQIVQKTTAPVQENKIVVQKSITIPSNESVAPIIQKQRVRKQAVESPAPMKKLKQEIAIAPAPSPLMSTTSPLPPLAPLSTQVGNYAPAVSNTVSVTTSAPYPDLDNFEELLPSTAIARQAEPKPPEPPIAPQPELTPTAPLSDGQLLAVPGEHFGGPAGSFFLCVEDNGTLTPIDNRPLVLDNNQLVPMTVEAVPTLAPQPERRDILEAALANSDVFHADNPRDEAPDFRDLNANVSVHCRVSETSTTLNQPIMTPVEVPTKGDSEPTVPSNLEDGLAVIGVTPHTVPTSLELPITVTDPRIAPKTTDPLSGNNYGTTLLSSPNTEMTFVTTEEVDMPSVGPISMPLLTEEESVGKSMPILTDDITERNASSVGSTVGSPSSIDVRESETEDGGQWTRRLLTPGSDTSETSAEIPLQPAIQLSVNDLSRNS